MKTKFTRVFAILLCLLTVMACGTQMYAASSYQTYTYSIDGEYMLSPDAYKPADTYDSAKMGLTTPLSNPADIVTDKNGDIYIADAGNNRIVVLDRYFKFKYEIKDFTNDQGRADKMSNPQGVFVADEKIYVADTNNARILIFEKGLDRALFYKIVNKPESDVFDANAKFTPTALAVDQSGRIYVVSSSTLEGIIAMTEQGAFVGFIGAQKVTYDVFEMFWRRFKSEEQLAKENPYLPTAYNNITIDERGFIYVTTQVEDEEKQQSAIEGSDGDYAPVRKFNSSGDDILKRNGFFAPSGEVDVLEDTTKGNKAFGASTITDVALGPEGTWSIFDVKRMKIFTYDSDGKLLFAFGDTGTQVGNLPVSQTIAMAYNDDVLMVLEGSKTTSVTTYQRTYYGDTLVQALRDTNNRQYDNSVANWKEILKDNNNFDAAYIGIGKALYREGKWEESMEYYRSAYDTENYSNSFKEVRKEWVAKYIWVIPIVLIALVVGILFFFRYAKKVNSRVAVSGEKKTFGKEILYGFHLIFHPFDAFWDLKHEKRGSVRGAIFFLALTVLAFTYNAVGQSYIFNPRGTTSSVLMQFVAVLVPFFLWVTANWCLTTLFEGEGSYKDIFIASSYALLPLPLIMIPATLATHILAESEAGIVSLLITLAWVWAIMLIVFGAQVTHDYTLGRNVLTTLGTIVGMVILMFMAILFSTLLTKIISFVSNIFVELSYRM